MSEVKTSECITKIIDGHDSELFSFLPEEYKNQLRNHPSANVPLWTFGDVTKDRELRSVPMWNGAGCFAWTKKPHVTPCNGSDRYVNYRGFVCDDELIQVNALSLVRHYFAQGDSVNLDDASWLIPCDRRLERLSYIRGWDGKSTDSPEWPIKLCEYFDWALNALEKLRKQSTTKTWESWVCNLEPLIERAAELGIKPNWHHLDRMRAELERDIGEHEDEPYIDSAHARRVEERSKLWDESAKIWQVTSFRSCVDVRDVVFSNCTLAEAKHFIKSIPAYCEPKIEKQESPSQDGLAMTERAQG